MNLRLVAFVGWFWVASIQYFQQCEEC